MLAVLVCVVVLLLIAMSTKPGGRQPLGLEESPPTNSSNKTLVDQVN